MGVRDMSRYKRITSGGFSNAMFTEADVNLFELVKNKQNIPWFVSMYDYEEKHKEQFDKTNSVAGIRDVSTNKLWWDFDSKDIEKARMSTIELVKRLLDYGFRETDLQIRYSGSKGFHVVIDTDKRLTPNQVEAIAHKFAGDIEGFDESLYDANQIMRIPLTKHPKTGVYCTPITYEELINCTSDELKEIASDISNFDIEALASYYTRATLPEELLVEQKKEEDKKETKRELTFDISEVDFSKRPKGIDKARWLLMNGFFRGSETADVGERNFAFLCLASTYKNMGYDKTLVLNLLKGVAELQAERTGETPFDEWELENNIVEQVFSPLWRGGQFSLKDKNSWLYKYAVRMGVDDIREDSTAPRKITDIAGKFTAFVQNIEDNTIKTGIDWLDKKMPIVIGSNVGLIGSSGSGKCLAKGTKVLMYSGEFKNVEDIVVGDLIMGDDSTPRKILSLARGQEEMFEVRPLRGKNYTVNRSHILSLYQDGRVVDISVEDYLNLPPKKQKRLKTFRVGVEYPEKEVYTDPYTIGSNVVKIKRIPELYLINSMSNRLQLLAGIIDKYGEYIRDSHFEINIESDNLKDDIVYLTRSCGFTTSFTRKGDLWCISFLGELHKIPTLDKSKRATKKKTNSNISGFSLVSKGVGDYYGFEIDGNKRFIIEDFTVTHNTSLSLDILSNTSKAGITSVFISLDMNSTRMFEKILRRVTGLSKEEIYHKYQIGEGEELTAMVEKEFPNVWFYDKTATTPTDIINYIRYVEEVSGEKVKLCMIDYFERVHSDMSDETAASKNVAAGLQDIVNETDVAMITIVQPNKFSLGGGPNTPILDYTSIKGSSFLYQAFRQIVSIWRDFYTPQTVIMDKFLSMAVLKNDLGSLGTQTFNWDGQTGTISPMTERDRIQYETWLAELQEEKEEQNNKKKANPWV